MKRRTVRIGGDDCEVMEEGNCFIETKRKRYSWRDGELKIPFARIRFRKNGKHDPSDYGPKYYTGRDIVEICGADFDKGREYECFIRMADGTGLRTTAPKIEDVPQSVAASDPETIKAVQDTKTAAEKAQASAEETNGVAKIIAKGLMRADEKLDDVLDKKKQDETPPRLRHWSVNLLNRFDQECKNDSAKSAGDICHRIAKAAVKKVLDDDVQILARKMQSSQKQCDYLSPRMYDRLLKKLRATGDHALITKKQGENFARYVREHRPKEKNHK